MLVDGLQAVDQFHQHYPGKLGSLEQVLGVPPTEGGDTVTIQVCER